MATQSVKDILDAEIPPPTWVLNPTKANPLPSEVDFSRNSRGRTLDTDGTFKFVGKDTPRIYGAQQDLLVEKESKQLVYNPQVSVAAWNRRQLSSFFESGTVFGFTNTKLREDTSNDRHGVIDFAFDAQSGSSVTISALVFGLNRDAVTWRVNFNDGSNNRRSTGAVRLSTGGTLNSMGYPIADFVRAGSIPVRGGWYLTYVTIENIESSYDLDWVFIGSHDGNSSTFPGNTSAGLNIAYLQAEGGVTPTTPIIGDTKAGATGDIRKKDNIAKSYSSSPDWWSTEGTWVIEWVRQSPSDQRDFIFKWGNNFLELRKETGDYRIYNPNTSNEYTFANAPLPEVGQPHTVTMAFDDQSIFLNQSETDSQTELNNPGIFNPTAPNISFSDGVGSIKNRKKLIRNARFIPKKLGESETNILTS
jgi:hypothetical protein